jgi:hypothetical protein
MPVSCEDHYKQLHVSCAHVLAQTFQADQHGLHAASHQFVDDLFGWYEALKARPENKMILAAISEYQFALLAVVFGQYRQAYMSLRLALELVLGSVHYSANEFTLRLWLKGSNDLVWASLISADNGVFSRLFVGTFYEELADLARQYGAIAESVYRECSEFVHGNAHTHSTESGRVVFQEQVFQEWHGTAKSFRLVTSFALCARYVRLMDANHRKDLETILLDSLGHIPAIRAIFGGPVESIDV